MHLQETGSGHSKATESEAEPIEKIEGKLMTIYYPFHFTWLENLNKERRKERTDPERKS